MDEGVSALGSRLETSMAEMRAALFCGNPNNTNGLIPNESSDGHDSDMKIPSVTPPLTIPTFDGSDLIAWLARAEQCFLVSKIRPENRVSVAMVALAGPALPWIQLLMQRIPTLSWDRCTQEMMKRFGETVAKNQPNILPTSNTNNTAILPSLPTVTAAFESSSSPSPPTTALQEIPTINTSTNHPDLGTTTDNSTPLPLPVQHPFLPPVCMTLPSPTRLPTPATVTAPLLSSSPGIMQIQSPFSSLLRCLDSASHQAKPMVVSFPGSLFSLAEAPFSYLVMLRLLHIVGHLLWIENMSTALKHELEPPPDKVLFSILTSALRARLF